MVTKMETFDTIEKLISWLFALHCLTPSDRLRLENSLCLIECNFPDNLRVRFPVLSEDDICIMLLLHIGISNVEIDRLLNILPSSFRMRRCRMKKKIGIAVEKLSDFARMLRL